MVKNKLFIKCFLIIFLLIAVILLINVMELTVGVFFGIILISAIGALLLSCIIIFMNNLLHS